VAITDISLNRITDPAELERLKAMEQFHGIPDELLLRLARRVTIFQIPDRWVAIRLIVANGIPIPVVKERRR
jgi:hypothetical protein